MTRPTLVRLLDSAAARRVWRAVLASLLATISVLALVPGDAAPELGLADKWQHLLAFTALGAAALWSVRLAAPLLGRVAVTLLAFGGAIELLQLAIPGRQGEWTDLLADAIGIGIGMCLAAALRAGARLLTR